jgi:hypothetical protein
LKETRKEKEMNEMNKEIADMKSYRKEKAIIFNIGHKVAYDTIEISNKKNECLQ